SLRREDWNRRGNLEEFLPRFKNWAFDWLDVPAIMRAADTIYEYPCVDRDPLERWTFGRVTLLGDAAHPMYPMGANGASQAIIDARVLADALAGQPGPAGLLAYEALRRPVTTNVVLHNRNSGPERVLDIAAARVKGPGDRIEDLISPAELEEVAAGYRQVAGFVKKAI